MHTSPSGYTPYQNFSLWDTYRPQNQLLEMLEPRRGPGLAALSVLAIGRDGGWLPRWALANSETNIMTGDPVTPFLVEALVRRACLAGHEDGGVRAAQAERDRAAPGRSASTTDAPGQHYYDEARLHPVRAASVGTDCVSHGGDNDCAHPASGDHGVRRG